MVVFWCVLLAHLTLKDLLKCNESTCNSFFFSLPRKDVSPLDLVAKHRDSIFLGQLLLHGNPGCLTDWMLLFPCGLWSIRAAGAQWAASNCCVLVFQLFVWAGTAPSISTPDMFFNPIMAGEIIGLLLGNPAVLPSPYHAEFALHAFYIWKVPGSAPDIFS